MLNLEEVQDRIAAIVSDESVSEPLREAILLEYELLLEHYRRKSNQVMPCAWRLKLRDIKADVDIVRSFKPVIPGILGTHQDDIMWSGRESPTHGPWHRVIYRRHEQRYILQKEKGAGKGRHWVNLFQDAEGKWTEAA